VVFLAGLGRVQVADLERAAAGALAGLEPGKVRVVVNFEEPSLPDAAHLRSRLGRLVRRS